MASSIPREEKGMRVSEEGEREGYKEGKKGRKDRKVNF